MKSTLVAFLALSSTISSIYGRSSTPNIVLIMCDDLGFSDLGCYGGEMNTPNIDRLAEDGVRFTQFKNTGRSCPSRASLLTGCYPHKADMGWMTAVDEHRPGYRGQLSPSLPTIAEVLKQKGYATYLSGKWHVTLDKEYDKPNGSYPTQRGFDRYYGALSGGGDYYKPTPLYTNLTRITDVDDSYYYTKAISDSAIHFIEQHPTEQPMFCYIAHYAPHLPLQAPQASVDLCRDRYREGFDKLRTKRFERLKMLGLIDAHAQLPLFEQEFGGKRPVWDDLTEQQQSKWINDMATYCAMVEIMDQSIGQVVDMLKKKGMHENTVYLFLSDNGSTFESGYIKQLMADLSNTPFRSYKSYAYNGGVSSPLIIRLPARYKQAKSSFSHQSAHIIDLLPTCLDFAKAKYPTTFKGESVSLDGESLFASLKGKKIRSRDLYFEHQSSCAIISGEWKLVRLNGKAPWELFNLTNDPFERKDLALLHPEQVRVLDRKWNEWAKKQNVFPFEYRGWGERIKHYSKLQP